MRFVDLTGKRFNYLTVIAFERKGKNYKSYWRAKCDCGKETVVQGYELTSGQTKSCGCYNHFLLNSGLRKKHGMSKTPIYSTWLRMISRCHWVNMTIQSNNTRKNVHITYNGETLTIAEAARKYNMPYKTLHKRIRTFGWSVIDAIETKAGEKRRG